MSLFRRGILHRVATSGGTGTGILGEVNTFSDLPVSATTGDRYLVLSYSTSTPTKLKGVYRWNGSSWDRQNGARAFDVVYDNSGSTLTSVNLEASTNELDTKVNGKEPAITSASTSDYYRGDKTFQPLNKTAVGLANVDNTSDLNKPISSATQTALNGKEPSFTKNTAFNKNFGTVSGTVAEGNDSRFTNHLSSFTQNSGQYIATDQIRAKDVNGLKLYDDGGNGIHVQDGGNVQISAANTNHLVTNIYNPGSGYASLYFGSAGVSMQYFVGGGSAVLATNSNHDLQLIADRFASNYSKITIRSANGGVDIDGDLRVNGSVSKSSGSFDIPHPDPNKKDTHRLRHYFVETPSAGGNIYKYQIECKEGENYINLPDYFKFLNKDSLVWVNPFKHFGRAWGEVIEDKKIKIVVEKKGVYNILVFGDRKDETAMKDFNKYGIEYQPNK